jgi:signal transduction histidine kinase
MGRRYDRGAVASSPCRLNPFHPRVDVKRVDRRYVWLVRSTRLVDPLFAVALCAWALAASGSDHAIEIPAALLMTLPLAFRRSAPLPAALAVAAGFALMGAANNPSESLATLVAVMVAAYSVAAAGDRRVAIAGVVALIAAGIAETALTGDDDYAFIVVVIGVAAAAGAAIGARGRQAEIERERAEERAVAAERERIARELHDSVAHAVSLMVVQAGAAETAVDGDSDAALALERIRATGHEAVTDLGRMVGLLRSEDVEPVHGIAQPERLVAPFRDAGLAVQLDVTGAPRALPPGLDAAVHRIAQEALTNALKHGDGSAALSIAYESDALRMRVTNAVAGRAAVGTEHGVLGMRERARLYGGELRAGPNGNGTYEVELRLPVPAQ